MIENIKEYCKELIELRAKITYIKIDIQIEKEHATNFMRGSREEQLIKSIIEISRDSLRSCLNRKVILENYLSSSSIEKEYLHSLHEFWNLFKTEGFDDRSEFETIIVNYREILKDLDGLYTLLDFFRDHYTKDQYSMVLQMIRSKIESYRKLRKEYRQFIIKIYRDSKDIGNLETRTYLIEHTSLLPLVYANNADPIKGITSPYRTFKCQFHPERKNSMRVSITENFFDCFGCCINGNQIDYLMEKHKISQEQAEYLLAETFMLYIPNNPYREPEHSELVNKYRETITSDEYRVFLSDAYNNIEKDDETEEKYSHLFSQIERIKRGEYDPDFNFEEKPKKFVYEKLDNN